MMKKLCSWQYRRITATHYKLVWKITGINAVFTINDVRKTISSETNLFRFYTTKYVLSTGGEGALFIGIIVHTFRRGVISDLFMMFRNDI